MLGNACISKRKARNYNPVKRTRKERRELLSSAESGLVSLIITHELLHHEQSFFFLSVRNFDDVRGQVWARPVWNLHKTCFDVCTRTVQREVHSCGRKVGLRNVRANSTWKCLIWYHDFELSLTSSPSSSASTLCPRGIREQLRNFLLGGRTETQRSIDNLLKSDEDSASNSWTAVTILTFEPPQTGLKRLNMRLRLTNCLARRRRSNSSQ